MMTFKEEVLCIADFMRHSHGIVLISKLIHS